MKRELNVIPCDTYVHLVGDKVNNNPNIEIFITINVVLKNF